MRQHVFKLLIVVMSGAAMACDESLSKIAGPTPNLEATFASIQRDVFEAPDRTGRPGCTSCHNARGRLFAGGLSLERTVAYDALVNVGSTGKRDAIRVVPGRPDDSYLIHKIEGRPGLVGGRMPNQGPYLSAGQVQILRRWIEIGAPRN